jgi:hypothetical protein
VVSPVELLWQSLCAGVMAAIFHMLAIHFSGFSKAPTRERSTSWRAALIRTKFFLLLLASTLIVSIVVGAWFAADVLSGVMDHYRLFAWQVMIASTVQLPIGFLGAVVANNSLQARRP